MKLEAQLAAWLEAQARSLRRSKGSIVRELIEERQQGTNGRTLGQRLHDLCGSLEGSRDLSTRSLKGYGRA